MTEPADLMRAWQEYFTRLAVPPGADPEAFERAVKAQSELQAQLARGFTAPFESLVEMLDELASGLRAQAASAEAAAASFRQSAELLARQAALVEHTAAEMRKPLAFWGAGGQSG
jgi:hypothetical protein